MGLCSRGQPKEEAPLFYDGPTCPYGIKPSDLFRINEVGEPVGVAGGAIK